MNAWRVCWLYRDTINSPHVAEFTVLATDRDKAIERARELATLCGHRWAPGREQVVKLR